MVRHQVEIIEFNSDKTKDKRGIWRITLNGYYVTPNPVLKSSLCIDLEVTVGNHEYVMVVDDPKIIEKVTQYLEEADFNLDDELFYTNISSLVESL